MKDSIQEEQVVAMAIIHENIKEGNRILSIIAEQLEDIAKSLYSIAINGVNT